MSFEAYRQAEKRRLDEQKRAKQKEVSEAVWQLIFTLCLFGPFLYVFGPALFKIFILSHFD